MPPKTNVRNALVFGGSGQIGRPVLARLVAAGWQVHAVSRQARPASAGVHWLRGDLVHVESQPERCDAIFSCGPLDHFARWYADSAIDCARVIAFGSTSIDVKQDSADATERDVASRLQAGEHGVFAAAATRGAAATVLRPTLVYGAGGDRTLTRIVAIARRWHRFVLPRDAQGLRQPVHVDDLADAALGVVDAPATHGRAYALPGGETLPYREMVARALATLRPTSKLHQVPAPLFRVLLATAHVVGIARDFGPAALDRMRDDLTFDARAAREDFGYAPRMFRPTSAMFGNDGEGISQSMTSD